MQFKLYKIVKRGQFRIELYEFETKIIDVLFKTTNKWLVEHEYKSIVRNINKNDFMTVVYSDHVLFTPRKEFFCNDGKLEMRTKNEK